MKMEVIEIISNFINTDTNVVEIEFRLSEDGDDVIRQDTIEFSTLLEFGYGSSFTNIDIFEEIDDINDEWDIDFDDDGFFIDDEELKNFLNEYYIVYSDRIPGPEYT
jgi:hypothetical protein